jgi:hypothetical protein
MMDEIWFSVSVSRSLQVDAGTYDGIEQAIKVAIALLSILLLALSLSAFRRTRLKRLLYASAAFGLFAVQMLVEFLEDATRFGEPYTDLITPGITLAIVLLFFVGIVRKG